LLELAQQRRLSAQDLPLGDRDREPLGPIDFRERLAPA
jgi:hypothetical protein